MANLCETSNLADTLGDAGDSWTNRRVILVQSYTKALMIALSSFRRRLTTTNHEYMKTQKRNRKDA